MKRLTLISKLLLSAVSLIVLGVIVFFFLKLSWDVKAIKAQREAVKVVKVEVVVTATPSATLAPKRFVPVVSPSK